jgi:hypothetical protein
MPFSKYGVSKKHQIFGHGYVYNAEEGLQHWRAAKADLEFNKNRILNVSCIGDSITAKSPNGWVDYLNALFASKYKM